MLTVACLAAVCSMRRVCGCHRLASYTGTHALNSALLLACAPCPGAVRMEAAMEGWGVAHSPSVSKCHVVTSDH